MSYSSRQKLCLNAQGYQIKSVQIKFLDILKLHFLRIFRSRLYASTTRRFSYLSPLFFVLLILPLLHITLQQHTVT